MDHDPDESPEKKYPPSPARMSKVPSWIMLGFLLGVLAGLAVRREPPPAPAKPPAAPVLPSQATVPPGARPRESLTKIEAVFADWGHLAIWDNNTTEVALWNSDDHAFSEFYEVRRLDRDLYFRSVPKLTRLILRHGTPPPGECPLLFTETEQQYREWREHGRFERPSEPIAPPPRAAPPAAPAVSPPENQIEPPPKTIFLPQQK